MHQLPLFVDVVGRESKKKKTVQIQLEKKKAFREMSGSFLASGGL